MIIRNFTKNDVLACATIHQSSRRESEHGIILDTDLDRDDLSIFIKNWEKWSDDTEITIFVASENDVILGFIMCGKTKTKPDFDRGVVPRFGAEIYALYVDPNHFRKNIGKSLFMTACHFLVDQKLTSMILWALKKNKRACGFYESLGGERVAKKRIDIGEKSWAEESCFAWRDVRKIL